MLSIFWNTYLTYFKMSTKLKQESRMHIFTVLDAHKVVAQQIDVSCGMSKKDKIWC
jgi:hypothetical protein